MDVAAAECRVVLTCDRHFVRARYSDHTFYVRSERKGEQLDEVRGGLARWLLERKGARDILLSG